VEKSKAHRKGAKEQRNAKKRHCLPGFFISVFFAAFASLRLCGECFWPFAAAELLEVS
jgi:hypothetical protein